MAGRVTQIPFFPGRRSRAALVLFLLAAAVAAGQIPTVILPYPLENHIEWWRPQFGRSRQNWIRFLGKEFINRNSGPACVVMVLAYKKGASIPLDFASFTEPRFPKIHSDARWKFCRDNPDKDYAGGFAPDDGAEATGVEMATVLTGEGIPTRRLSGFDRFAVAGIAEIIKNQKIAVCRVDPSAYFPDERPGERRWVVVFGADKTSFIVHDPGRVEGKSRAVLRAAFEAALKGTDEGRSAEVLDCITLVGEYADGWHAYGASSLFRDAYYAHEHEIGIPFDNGGSIFVHAVGPVTAQDYDRPVAHPRSVEDGKSLLAFNPDKTKVFFIGAEFHEKYFKMWAFDSLGAPTSDPYLTEFGRRQDFDHGYLLSTGREVIASVSSPAKKME